MVQRSCFTRRSFVTLLSSAAVVLPRLPAYGQTSPRTLLARLFTDSVQPEWFTSDFLAQVPLTQVNAIINSTKTAMGAFVDVSYVGGAYFANFASGRIPIFQQLNDSDQFVGLILYPPQPKSTDESSVDVDSVLTRVWTQSPPSANDFTDAFLHQVPIAQVISALASLQSQGGAFKRIETMRGTHFAVYDKARFPLFVYVDASGKIYTLIPLGPQAVS